MWILTVVILFAAGATGMNIPEDRYEGPYMWADQHGAPLRFASVSECQELARAEQPNWTEMEVHMHQTRGLEVRWSCVPEQRDL